MADFTPIYARIQTFIRDEIASGRLKEGARTPSEPELARLFGTTRATVARALQQLVFEGVVIRRSGSGTFVAPASLSAPIDLTRVRSFEEQVAAKGAEIAYETLHFLRRPVSAGESATLHLAPDGHVYELDRLRLVNGKRMSIEHRVIPDELGRHITPAMLEAKSLHRILDEEFDLQVQRVEGRIRAGLARGQTADRLGVRRGSPVLIRDYVLFSADRRPLVGGESCYRDEFHIDYVVQQPRGASV
ncbi:HTH-type transcriptional repressor YvoA [Starkeya nomas]|uniref:HTH-type transcriptional repressor YvoA n=1 Tax=Starkeya nomas TaxID=2666134 RepID=A0A5S9PB02_9HYPH|nr:GntR family transcriptional regulator [Starkeya nomas]CAA0100980.1 HTH-type transcriptional repressor YvoA [Starkeya nomas]